MARTFFLRPNLPTLDRRRLAPQLTKPASATGSMWRCVTQPSTFLGLGSPAILCGDLRSRCAIDQRSRFQLRAPAGALLADVRSNQQRRTTCKIKMAPSCVRSKSPQHPLQVFQPIARSRAYLRSDPGRRLRGTYPLKCTRNLDQGFSSGVLNFWWQSPWMSQGGL
jgi:hypothetical protein